MLMAASVTLLVLAGGFLTVALWLDAQPAVQAQDDRGAIGTLSVSSPGPGQLAVAWSAPSERPTDYRVRWAPSGQDYLAFSEPNTSERGSAYPTGTSHTVSSLAAGAFYKVQVRARYNAGEHADNPWSGPWSAEATVTIASPPPPPPTTTPDPTPETTPEPTPAADAVTGVAVSSDTAGQLAIAWTQPTDEPTDYRISWTPAGEEYPSHSEENTSRRGNSYPAGGATSLTLTGLPGGVSYKVIMRARYHNEQTGEHSSGPWTDEVTQRVRNNPPAAPTGLNAAEVSDSSVTLSWTAPNSSGITGYRVLRGLTAAKRDVLVNDTGSTGTEYVDRNVEVGTGYHYSVRAINDGGVGPASNTIAVTAGRQAVGPRQNPTAPAFPDMDGTSGADPVTLTIAENVAPGTAVGTVSASDADGDTLTYSASGTDAGVFSLDTGTGAITVKTGETVDYEDRASYSITVSVTDGKDGSGTAEGTPITDDSVAVTINVTNVDEAGTVTLSVEQPELAIPLRAELADPDGGESGVTWQWAHGAAATGPFTDISGATNARHTPTSADVGKHLRATASYTDTEGSGKSADAVSANAVNVVGRKLVNNFGQGSDSGFGGLDPVHRRGSSPEGIRRDTSCTM